MFGRNCILFAENAALVVVVVGLVMFPVNCHAKKSDENCTQYPSSCGDIGEIRYPFRLKGDSENCGDKKYELDCENNRTVLTLYSGKYYVQAIDYHHEAIRLVDVGIHSIDNCSFLPLHTLVSDNFSYADPSSYHFHTSPEGTQAVAAFMSCDKPVKSPLYVEITGMGISSCDVNTSYYYNNKGQSYSYVAMGELNIGDVADLCRVDMVVMISLPAGGSNGGNLSLLDVHNALAYGFQLSWDHPDVRLYHYSVLHCIKVILRPAYWRGIPQHVALGGIPRLVTLGGLALLFFAARMLIGMPCVVGFLIYKFKRRHLSTFDNIEDFLRSQNDLGPIRYSYTDINKMTIGFRDKLGEGGYGSVFKGKLRSGHLAAIKMLSKPKANGQEFINEVATIGRIHHVNVVQLVGYCAERSKRALVYDFMPNGSLEKYIARQEGNFALSCEQMYQISIGVARGIDYLHRGCDMQILHFDIKPHNILLDENFTPKVSDFGLAKLYPTDDSIVSLTAARGTLGYMAPELFYKNIGGVSYKADVYSFGMLLMEMAGRRRNWNSSVDSSQIFFPSWVYDQFAEGRNLDMGESTEEESEIVKKMMLVALWCIQMKPSDRPSMTKVLEMLEGNIEFLQMPPKPFLYPQAMPTENYGIEENSTEFPNLSGACMDSITLDVSAR